MNHNNMIKSTLISTSEIKQRVKQMGREISTDYRRKRPLAIGLLKGGWVFMADLVRAMSIDVEVDFVALSSYGSGTESSGQVSVTQKLNSNVKGRHVLIVEDIVDSGVSLSFLKQDLLAKGAKSVRIATLLSKRARRKVDIDVEYIGFEIPDEFVVGYGMDFDEAYRTLRDVCVLKEEAYSK